MSREAHRDLPAACAQTLAPMMLGETADLGKVGVGPGSEFSTGLGLQTGTSVGFGFGFGLRLGIESATDAPSARFGWERFAARASVTNARGLTEIQEGQAHSAVASHTLVRVKPRCRDLWLGHSSSPGSAYSISGCRWPFSSCCKRPDGAKRRRTPGSGAM